MLCNHARRGLDVLKITHYLHRTKHYWRKRNTLHRRGLA